MTPDLEPLLARVPGWAGRVRATTPLDGGITNRNVLVEVGDDRFVLRINGPDTQLLEIRRADELVAARRAAELGLAPEVHAFLEPEQYLVTRFVTGTALRPGDLAAEPMVLAQAVFALRAFHLTAPLAGDFDAFTVPGRHLAAARSRGVAVPHEYELAAGFADRIAAAFAASPEPRVPCHNDLLPANFLRDGERLWLIDWEYAGNNDRYFDLGNLSVNHGFDGAIDEAVVTAYFGGVTPRRLARLALMKLMSDFREAMWGVVQQGISTLDVDYVDYARTHFDRMLANAARPGFAGLLADAAAPD